jgi:3-hydroxy acid dehydrogenase/malonic semialdehyde reductase
LKQGAHFLLTGASSGIGHAVALALLQAGYRVTGVHRSDPASLDASTIDARINAVSGDLANIGQLESTIDELVSENDFDGFIHCAGIGDFGSVEEFSVKRLRRLFDINVMSAMVICRKLIPQIKKNAGVALFIGSDAALKGSKRGAAYCASKFALRGFAQALREECSASSARVSIINPGMVDSPFYDNLDFAPGLSQENALRSSDVAAMVMAILELPSAAVVDEITLTPVKKVIRRK